MNIYYLTSQIQFHKNIIDSHKKQIIILQNIIDDINNISDNTPDDKDAKENKFLDNNMNDELDIDSQDIIWQRIKNAHLTTKDPNGELPKDPNGELPKDPNGELPKDPNGELPKDPNGELPKDPNGELPKDPNGELPKDPNGELPKEKEKPKLIPVNALSRFNPTQQNQILKNIFNKATNNIDTLKKLDHTITEQNYDIKIQEEADKLLKVYLESH